MKTSGSWFWDESIWLPPNVTWSNLEPNGDKTYSNFADLYWPIPGALLVLILRYLFERAFFRPLGLYMGLKPRKNRKLPTNELLEDFYQKNKTNGKKALFQDCVPLSQKLHMSERQVERWLRKRRLQCKVTVLEKFTETGWVCFYYTCVYIYGIVTLVKKSWFWDIRNCWYNYPHHPVDSDVWWYYMIELSFYWSLLFSIFFDIKRKDFWEMFVHHITTILLMGFSWTCNLARVGTLVLVIHDIADIFLGAAKLCKYANLNKSCDILFVCFALTWLITRIGIYPTWILYSTTIEAPQIVEMFPAYYIFNALLSILLVLNVIWTYFIFKIVHKSIFIGKFEKDSRSETSDTGDESTFSSSSQS